MAMRHRKLAEPGAGNGSYTRRKTHMLDDLATMALYRRIQIGIPGALSSTWTGNWIASIEDVTDKSRNSKSAIDARPDITIAELAELGLIPSETIFSIKEPIVEA